MPVLFFSNSLNFIGLFLKIRQNIDFSLTFDVFVIQGIRSRKKWFWRKWALEASDFDVWSKWFWRFSAFFCVFHFFDDFLFGHNGGLDLPKNDTKSCKNHPRTHSFWSPKYGAIWPNVKKYRFLKFNILFINVSW